MTRHTDVEERRRRVTNRRIPWHPMTPPDEARSNEVFIDISDDNARDFNAREYAAAGHLLVAIKATQGTDFTDPYWADWTDAAHENRLGVAHYHFCAVDGDPLGEARHFWQTVRPRFHAQADRLVLDLEVGDQAYWPEYLRALDDELVRYATVKPIGYTFASADLEQLILQSRKWWLAAWGTDQPSAEHCALPGGQWLWGWQYYGGTVNPSRGPTESAGQPTGAVDHSVLAPGIVRLLHHQLRR